MLNCTTSQSSVSGRPSVGARGDDEIDEHWSSIWTRGLRACVLTGGWPGTATPTRFPGRLDVDSRVSGRRSVRSRTDRTDDAEILSDLLLSRAGKGYLVS